MELPQELKMVTGAVQPVGKEFHHHECQHDPYQKRGRARPECVSPVQSKGRNCRFEVRRRSLEKKRAHLGDTEKIKHISPKPVPAISSIREELVIPRFFFWIRLLGKPNTQYRNQERHRCEIDRNGTGSPHPGGLLTITPGHGEDGQYPWDEGVTENRMTGALRAKGPIAQRGNRLLDVLAGVHRS